MHPFLPIIQAMDVKAQDTTKRPRIPRSFFGCRIRLIRSQSVRDDGANRRRHLLLEFLQKKYTKPLANVREGTSSSQNVVNKIENRATLPDDLLWKILILLPAELLVRLQFLCKKWFNLINGSDFIRCHAQQSDTVLICQKLTLLEPGNHIHPRHQSEAKLKSYFHLLDLHDGENDFIESNVIEVNDVKTSCGGLVVASLGKNKNLMLMNPTTRKHILLPSGVNADVLEDSYGVSFCSEEKTYKVVHLFRKMGRQIGCEILNVGVKTWRTIKGPVEILREIIKGTTEPVSISGSLYWMAKMQYCDYFVSMNMLDENFITKKLPVRGTKDKLLEIGGSLGFVSDCAEVSNRMQVWILMVDGKTWMKRYSIDVSGYTYSLFPICSTRNGKDIVLENTPGLQLYVYDSDKDEVRLMHSRDDDDEGLYERMEKLYIPHRNTLASWDW